MTTPSPTLHAPALPPILFEDDFVAGLKEIFEEK